MASFPVKSISTEPPTANVYYAQKAYDDAPVTAVPIVAHAPTTPLATPYSIASECSHSPPLTAASLSWLTLKLIPFHLFNFVLATVAFCIEVTGVSLAVGLLPLCLVGIPIYYGVLHITRVLAIADVALANMITPCHATARLDVPDTDPSDDQTFPNDLRLAPSLTRVSLRSSLVVLYFASLKFALGIASIVVVSLPLLPIASHIVSRHTNRVADGNNYVAGWEVHTFNFDTHPVAYACTSVGYFLGGLVLMHVMGVASRETTRVVCCVPSTRGQATASLGGVV